MSRQLDICTDMATSRLVSVAQAVQLTGMLPAASAKTLVANAKAVRLFLLAGEVGVAESVLNELEAFATTSDDGEALVPMIRRHITAVRKAVRPLPAPAITRQVARAS